MSCDHMSHVLTTSFSVGMEIAVIRFDSVKQVTFFSLVHPAGFSVFAPVHMDDVVVNA